MAKRDGKAAPPALVPRLVRISELKEDPDNARTHSERNLEAIERSLKRFGQQKPIVITPDNVVRAGNGTMIAARRLGWSSINCVITTLQTPEELRAYAIADNRVGELSDFDDAVLAEQLASLGDSELIEAVGFDEAELSELQLALDPMAPQKAPAVPRIGRASKRTPSARVMLNVEQIEEFERAIRATGVMNRADALLTICRHYNAAAGLSDGNEQVRPEGKLDDQAEDSITPSSLAGAFA